MASAPRALRDPWLIAVWPGMGSVAVAAGSYLVVKLRAPLASEVTARDLFDVPHVEIKKGLVRPGRMPRNLFFEWRDPQERRDLLIFVGEAQPAVGGYAFCHKLLDYAHERGVTRLFTFAAMATQLHPTGHPRVFGISTDRAALKELTGLGVEILEEGQISGLNGVLLAAGAERNIPGTCLLGELPFFAAGVPNPRASQAVLEIFSKMSGVEFDLTDIKAQADAVEQGLVQLLEKMREAARRQQAEAGAGEEGFTIPEFAREEAAEEEEAEGPKPPETDSTKAAPIKYAVRRRIEKMFEAASQDRSRALHLKEELDRLGVFKQYENRFLDLFKKGE